MCYKLGSLWSEGNFHFRQNLQKLVFPDGVLFDKKIDGYRTEIDNAVFDIFRRFSDDYKNNKGTADNLLSLFVECPAKLSNFFEDFNKIVDFIEKHCVLNKGYNINSL